MFVWMFHRISGLVLILLLSLQVVTGMLQGSTSSAASVKDIATLLHKHPAVNCVLVFCIIFHGLYGVRTMVLDLGLKRERALFWLCTVAGSALFAVFLMYYFHFVAT